MRFEGVGVQLVIGRGTVGDGDIAWAVMMRITIPSALTVSHQNKPLPKSSIHAFQPPVPYIRELLILPRP